MKPVGPYSIVRKAGDLIFLSGQIGVNRQTGELEIGLEKQLTTTLENIQYILSQEQLNLKNVIKVTIFMKSIADYQEINQIYERYFTSPFPARSAVAVKDLPRGALVEIECICQITI